MLNDVVKYEQVNMASVLDIACMKITAISSRGSKKDFYDMWMILQENSLEEIFKAVQNKYEGIDYSLIHLTKSLTYFEDAQNDPDPISLVDTNWLQIQQDIQEKVKKANVIPQ